MATAALVAHASSHGATSDGTAEQGRVGKKPFVFFVSDAVVSFSWWPNEQRSLLCSECKCDTTAERHCEKVY